MTPGLASSGVASVMSSHGDKLAAFATATAEAAAPVDASQPHAPFEAMFPPATAAATFHSFAPTSEVVASTSYTSGDVGQGTGCAFPRHESHAAFQANQSVMPHSDFLARDAGTGSDSLAINAMSQMTENELMWVINPATFEQ